MDIKIKKRFPPPLLFTMTVVALIIAILFCTHVTFSNKANDVHSFSEPFIEIPSGWTLVDSNGKSKSISMPYILQYGTDGVYSLVATLPTDAGLLASPAFMFYANYLDVDIYCDGALLLSYPNESKSYPGSTGNVYHFVRLPVEYQGKEIKVDIRCQLGDDITYQLNPPIVGSKATILNSEIRKSIPFLLAACCMMLLSIALFAIYVPLRKKIALDDTTLYMGLFSLMFSLYIYCECTYVQFVGASNYAISTLALLLLSLIPLPLIGLFAADVDKKYYFATSVCAGICIANFLIQTVLNIVGVSSYRAMLPATHVTIIVSMVLMVLSMLMSDSKENPRARTNVLSATPMIAGGIADIVLIWINKPSTNNSMWFTFGVTAFIIIQFSAIVYAYFAMYRHSTENAVLRDMAFCDMLTGLCNRNAYERKLNELSAADSLVGLCCIVADINCLKQINDCFGHSAGDAAIIETGKMLGSILPTKASCFRTGGDEFVVLTTDISKDELEDIVKGLKKKAAEINQASDYPYYLAIGYGSFEASDVSLPRFIRRIDGQMYDNKRVYKESHPFNDTCSTDA